MATNRTRRQDRTTKLAQIIVARGIRQNWLSEQCGYGNGVIISELACGKRPMTPARAMRIAKVLGVPVGDLMETELPADPNCPTCGRPLDLPGADIFELGAYYHVTVEKVPSPA